MNLKLTENKGIHLSLNKSTSNLERRKKFHKNFSKKVKGLNFVNFWLKTKNLLTFCQLKHKTIQILHLINNNRKSTEIEEESWEKIIIKNSWMNYKLTYKFRLVLNWKQTRSKLSCKNFQNFKRSKKSMRKSFSRILKSLKKRNKWPD